MRIAYISDYLADYHLRAGGADWACWRIGELLNNKYFFIEYFTRFPDKKDKNKAKNIHFVPITEDFFPLFIAKYLEVLKWYIWQIDPFALIYFLLKFLWQRPDIVHLHRFRSLTMSPLLAARLLKIPVYFSVYDYWMFCVLETLIDEKNLSCRRFHGLWCWKCTPKKFIFIQQGLLLFRKFIFNLGLYRINRFVVLSTSSLNILTEYGIDKEKITIIPLSYDKKITENPRPESPEENTLLYVGWIQKRKGLDILLKALAIVKSKISSVKLYIIGKEVIWEKQYRLYLEQIIEENNLNDNIIWLGQKSNDEVQKFIRKSEIVIVPEQWGNMSPLIIGEAMFNYRPVIASCLGGIPDFVLDSKTGFLFEPRSISDLAEKIIYLLKNKNIAIQMGDKARELAEKIFSEKTIINKYLDLYFKIKEKN